MFHKTYFSFLNFPRLPGLFTYTVLFCLHLINIVNPYSMFPCTINLILNPLKINHPRKMVALVIRKCHGLQIWKYIRGKCNVPVFPWELENVRAHAHVIPTLTTASSWETLTRGMEGSSYAPVTHGTKQREFKNSIQSRREQTGENKFALFDRIMYIRGGTHARDSHFTSKLPENNKCFLGLFAQQYGQKYC